MVFNLDCLQCACLGLFAVIVFSSSGGFCSSLKNPEAAEPVYSGVGSLWQSVGVSLGVCFPGNHVEVSTIAGQEADWAEAGLLTVRTWGQPGAGGSGPS